MCCINIDNSVTNHTFLSKILAFMPNVWYNIFRINRRIEFIMHKLQHNMDYVLAAAFCGGFYIINRIFSIR